MNISLDYDLTYTLDPESWNKFIDLMTDAGHKVYCFTLRYPSEMTLVYHSIGEKIEPKNCIPCSRESKYEKAKTLDINIDVWIDDNPQYVYENIPEDMLE